MSSFEQVQHEQPHSISLLLIIRWLKQFKVHSKYVVLQNENRTVSNCFVVGDEVQVEVGDNVLTGLNCLLYCYYVWDLS